MKDLIQISLPCKPTWTTPVPALSIIHKTTLYNSSYIYIRSDLCQYSRIQVASALPSGKQTAASGNKSHTKQLIVCPHFPFSFGFNNSQPWETHNGVRRSSRGQRSHAGTRAQQRYKGTRGHTEEKHPHKHNQRRRH